MNAVLLESLISSLGSEHSAAVFRLLREGGVEDLLRWLSRQIADIDRALSRQMDAILHHPEFQALESAWRGLSYLLSETQAHLLPTAHSLGRIRSASGRPGLRIRIFAARRDEWEENFTQAARFDRAHFWTEVFAREFDTAGGEPFGLVLCDYRMGDKASLKLVEDFSKAAMGGFCPILFRAAPELFGAADFSRLCRKPPDWKPELAADMEGFRTQPEASFAALMLPDMRLREPYRLDGSAAWPYREQLDASGRQTALWGHAGWSYLASIMLTFVETGWVYSLDKRMDGTAPAPLADAGSRPMAAEVYISAAVAARLSELGCCAVYAERTGESLDFVRPVTLFRIPRALRMENPDCLPSGDSLPAMLAVSRIAHFLKSAARERAGTFSATTSTIQQTLSGWLKDYVSDRDGDAARPLAKQEVEVTEVGDGGPGRFRVQVKLWLKPVWGRKREGDFSFPFSVGGG